MKRRLLTSLAALCAVLVTGCSNQASGESAPASPAATTRAGNTEESQVMPSAEALPPEENDIGSDTAKSIALEDAGLTENNVEFIRSNLDYDDGKKVYDVEFYAGNREYDYEIDASTGDIISRDYETESYNSTRKSTTGKAPDNTSKNTIDKTLSNTSKNTRDKAVGSSPKNNTDKTLSNTSENNTTGKAAGSNGVTLAQAKKIALKKAGLAESDGYWNKEKTDREDGRTVYELEFTSGETEYEFEIDAKSGNILEYERV